MKQVLRAFSILVVLLIAIPLHAQTGCADSPENPTVLLGALGALGGSITLLRARSGGTK